MQGVPKIPYFQTSRYRVATMVELAQPKPGELVADLGTGDGRIAIAFAQTGAHVDAYEIDEALRKLAEENIKKELINSHPDSSHASNAAQGSYEHQNDNITKPTILNKDFWTVDLSQYNIICCYPMPTIMGRLERKLQTELKPGSRVVLNYFPFLHWKEKTKKDNIFLYIK